MILNTLSQHLPVAAQGCLKGHSSKKVWLDIAWRVEDALVSGNALHGLVLDIVKAFHALPRKPFFEVMARLRFPPGILRAWQAAFRSMQRCFRIHGGLERPLLTTHGLPEGDPLSVVPMCLRGGLGCP